MRASQRLSSDTEWREIDPKTAVMEVTRAFQTMLENLFQQEADLSVVAEDVY